MKQLSFALLLAAAPLAAGDLRLFNASDKAVAATIGCAGGTSEMVVAPHAFADASGDDCRVAAAAPLLVLRMESNDVVEWQIAEAAPNDSCPSSAPLFLPANGCRFGSAIAAVTPVDGAAYSWSVDGGSILSGAGTERVLIALEGGDSARVSAAVTKNGCTTTASGVMALHDALHIATFDAGKGNVNEPRTVSWTYANGTPATQVLSGPDFAQPVTLDPGARSYTFTPQTAGDHEVVLQASMAEVLGRSRAAGHGGGSASSCNLARASASFHVDCTRPDTTINVPGSVSRGKAFQASVALAPGSTASWTIANGTPATATGDTVSITPNNDNPVEVGVTVVATGGCTASASAHVVIDLTGTCDNPTAKVSIKENDCGGSIATAVFTGKPPFHGTWSDGTPFQTGGFSVDRTLASGTATYAISAFSDAYCAGAASNSVTMTAKKPTVTLASSSLCAGKSTTVTATFTGAPPFNGRWSDGTFFTTSSTTLQRTVSAGGPLSMTFGDANCSNITSQSLDLAPPGTATLAFENGSAACAVAGSTKLDVTISGGTPPYKVTWSDGYVQQSNASPIVRTAYNYTGVFGITRVQDLSCDLNIANAIVSAQATPVPLFGFNSSYWPFCAGVEYIAFLSPNGIPSGGSLSWGVENGTILSGQGTSQLHFTPVGSSGYVRVTATLTVNGCPMTYQDYASIAAQYDPAQIALSSSTTSVGQPVTVTVTAATPNYYVSVTPRTGDSLTLQSNVSTTKSIWKFTPGSTGSVTFAVQETGACNGTNVKSSAQITVQ